MCLLAVFWRPVSFLKGDRGEVDLVESGDGCGKLGGMKGTVVGIYSMREEPIFIEVLGMLEIYILTIAYFQSCGLF